ncbi:MAG: PorT family protein [Pseudarcicella sp.]|nr:PorT family protein [Pseudarcicella sp.]
MKKVFLSAAIFCFLVAESQAQFRIGAKAGANFTNITEGPTSGTLETFDNKLGVRLGLVVEKSLSSNFALQSGLLYNQQGTYKKAINEYIILNYVELPLLFMFKPFSKFSVGAGPYLAYGISEVSKNGTVVTTKNDFGDSFEPELFDYGFQALVGYEVVNNLVLGASYSMGLQNISQDKTFSRKLSGFGVSLTKFFGSKKTDNVKTK